MAALHEWRPDLRQHRHSLAAAAAAEGAILVVLSSGAAPAQTARAVALAVLALTAFVALPPILVDHLSLPC